MIIAGVKHVVYAGEDADASSNTRQKFSEAEVSFEQVKDKDIITKAINLFNSTCVDKNNWLPLLLLLYYIH